MRKRFIVSLIACLFLIPVGFAGAEEKTINQLPDDIVDVATVWTEPIKQVHKRSAQFDPIIGLWVGIIEGSVKSVKRVVSMVFSPDDEPHVPPRKSNETFRYTF